MVRSQTGQKKVYTSHIFLCHLATITTDPKKSAPNSPLFCSSLSVHSLLVHACRNGTEDKQDKDSMETNTLFRLQADIVCLKCIVFFLIVPLCTARCCLSHTPLFLIFNLKFLFLLLFVFYFYAKHTSARFCLLLFSY